MVGSGLMGMFLFLTYYFQGNLGYSALKTGFAFLPFSAGIILAAGVSSKIIPRTGPKPVMVAGFTAATLGMLWLTQIGAHTSFAAHVLPAEILISVGMGLAFVPMSSTALFGVPSHDAGVASATLNATQQIGGSLGTALLNTVFASTTAAYLATRVDTPAVREAAQIHGYTVGFAIGAVFLAIAALSAGFLIKRQEEGHGRHGRHGTRPGLIPRPEAHRAKTDDVGRRPVPRSVCGAMSQGHATTRRSGLHARIVDPPAVVRLRKLHRCLMCHKHCLIPCKFTAMEFQQILRDELEQLAPDAGDAGAGSSPSN